MNNTNWKKWIYRLILIALPTMWGASGVTAMRCEALLSQTVSHHASVEEVQEVFASYPRVRETVERVDEVLERREFRAPIRVVDEIPVCLSRCGNKSPLLKLSRDPMLRRTITAVYNSMNNKKAFSEYLSQLLSDGAVLMMKERLPKEQKLLEEGKVSRRAILKVIVARSRLERQIEIFSVRSRDYAEFGHAVRNGVFFDDVFPRGHGHGVDVHLLQMDYVAGIVSQVTQGRAKFFWDFIGSEQGFTYWNELFDTVPSPGGANTLAYPETFTEIFRQFVSIH